MGSLDRPYSDCLGVVIESNVKAAVEHEVTFDFHYKICYRRRRETLYNLETESTRKYIFVHH